MGRLVITHSTYLEGLIPRLKKLAKLPCIKTITPATIKKVKGRSERLNIRITSQVLGGFKLVARKGSLAQEVFILTDLSKENLQIKINEYDD